jgi:hypothetical protein
LQGGCRDEETKVEVEGDIFLPLLIGSISLNKPQNLGLIDKQTPPSLERRSLCDMLMITMHASINVQHSVYADPDQKGVYHNRDNRFYRPITTSHAQDRQHAKMAQAAVGHGLLTKLAPRTSSPSPPITKTAPRMEHRHALTNSII